MNARQVIDYYGSVRATADAAGCSVRAVYKWLEFGLPKSRAWEFYVKSNGSLQLSNEQKGIGQDIRGIP